MRHGTVRRLQCAGLAALLLVTGCASGFKKDEKAINQETVNCATADGDIRVLKGEKAHVAEQIALGVTAIWRICSATMKRWSSLQTIIGAA